jgi:hypothetical protein
VEEETPEMIDGWLASQGLLAHFPQKLTQIGAPEPAPDWRHGGPRDRNFSAAERSAGGRGKSRNLVYTDQETPFRGGCGDG